MRYLFGFMCVLALGVVGCGETAAAEESEFPEAEGAAIEALQIRMQAFNDRDAEALAAADNYPHARVAQDGSLRVLETPEEFMATYVAVTIPRLEAEGWDHSEYNSMEVVQSSANKVHIAFEFSRYDADGNAYLTSRSLYIVTEQDGHWGTKARSRLSP